MTTKQTKVSEFAGERLAKRMARAGVCSRREAEKLIEQGKVTVDGKTVTSPALNVTDANLIEVNGQPLETKAQTRLWLYHKPPGLLTSHRDPEGRKLVFGNLPKELPRVVSVGRLDFMTEGLLLLTNNGELANHLASPKTGMVRRYRVRVHGKPSEDAFRQLKKGLVVGDIHYGSITAKPAAEQGTGRNIWLDVSLQEGKNREIRNVFEHLGHPASRLIRLSYGPFQLGKLAPGEVKELPRAVLKSQLGKWADA